ncbi:MAG TPA: response regulator [Polyangiales bacterium]|nr:response regulator [Polyangiales bacterium]
MADASVLIVDDNPANLKLAAYLLSSKGYAVDTAVDAETALASLKTRKPDLIMLDLHMPGMDGLALTRSLRSDPNTCDIRILAVTADAMRGDDLRALAAGCDGYVAKPIDTRILPALVQDLIERQ